MRQILLPALALASLIACNPPPSQEEYDLTRGGRGDVFFNDPGTRPDNQFDADMAKTLVDMVDNAKVSIDFAVMGFSYMPLVDAFERAWDRGVVLRMVGDAGYLSAPGYTLFRDRHFPMMVGNLGHIMHDKFMVVDGRFVFAGTANWSDSDLLRNSNNAVVIDNPYVAADFTQEFEQMYAGRFGVQKQEIDNGRRYQVGDTEVEVWFSPNEDAMGRMLEVVGQAQEELRFTIFAFTKDQLGSEFVRLWDNGVDVSGVIDQSQLHSNGQYHEAYRLLQAGIPVRMDPNDNSVQPGDYQAGGGRLHSKTMLVDAHGDDPTVMTGSFNWSSSASQSNDEYLFVLKGARIAQDYQNYFDYLYGQARPLGIDFVGEDDGDVRPGDIVINEIMWYGVTADDADGFDEFIEIKNRTDRDIRLDMWQISNELDFVVGFPPGCVLPANGTFLVLDHSLEKYVDGAPQDEPSAYTNGDLVLNVYNDNRQSRLYLKDGNLELYLRDPHGAIVDRAGDGGAAFAGGPDGAVTRSMERNSDPGDGSLESSWHSCDADPTGANVTPAYREDIIATPGEENSPG